MHIEFKYLFYFNLIKNYKIDQKYKILKQMSMIKNMKMNKVLKMNLLDSESNIVWSKIGINFNLFWAADDNKSVSLWNIKK